MSCVAFIHDVKRSVHDLGANWRHESGTVVHRVQGGETVVFGVVVVAVGILVCCPCRRQLGDV